MLSECPVISNCSRADSIKDGVLFDITDVSNETGFFFPIAVTKKVWEYLDFKSNEKDFPNKDKKEKILDLLNMLRFAFKRSNNSSEILFQVIFHLSGPWNHYERGVGDSGKYARLVPFKAIIGTGDDFNPVITIMCIDEVQRGDS